MSIKAIDISAWQSKIDLNYAKSQGIEAVIVKSTEGLVTSSTWESHINNALKAGITQIGAYSFVIAKTVPEAKQHAKKFIEALSKVKGKINLPVFADMESEEYLIQDSYGQYLMSVAERTKILITFLEELKAAGYYAAVYINPAWLENFIDKTQIIDKYDIWLAAWTNDPNKPTKYNYGQTMWQWGSYKTLKGSNQTDGDLIFVDYPTKIRSLGKNFLTQKYKTETVCTMFYSYGNAAIRTEPYKSASIIKRCEKDRIYPIENIATINGTVWLQHAETGTWSMERDGAILFKAKKPYKRFKTTARINVRTQPSTLAPISGVLEHGVHIFVSEYNKDWSKIVYNGIERYVSSTYIKEVI